MNKSITRFVNQLLPFVFAGIAIVAFAFGIILLAYLFLFGALLGFALFLASWLRNKLFPTKNIVRSRKTPSGRIIDHDEPWSKD